VLDPEPCRRDHQLATGREIRPVRHREERDAVEVDPLHRRVGVERDVEHQVPALMRRQTGERAAEEPQG
jgi:hypothetical protein